MWIDGRDDGGMSPLNRRATWSPAAAEWWRLSAQTVPLALDDLRAVRAVLHRLRGRVHAARITLPATHSALQTADPVTLAVAAAAQATRLQLAGIAGSTVLRGTLIAIGTLGTAGYQVCEVLEDAAVSGGGATVSIAPRLKASQLAGAAAVLGGAVVTRWRMLDDDAIDATERPGQLGVLTVEMVEAS